MNIADNVFLLPIYPARELPIEGITSKIIAIKMDKQKAVCCDKEELMSILDDMEIYGDDLDLLITAGAGDVDTMVLDIKKMLLRRK